METWWLLGVLAGEDLALLMPWVAISSLVTSLLGNSALGGTVSLVCISRSSIFQAVALV